MSRGVGDRDAVSLLAWGFGFAALFGAIVAPWWSFPASIAGDEVSLLGHLADHHLPVWALIAWMLVPGTIIPFYGAMFLVASLMVTLRTRWIVAIGFGAAELVVDVDDAREGDVPRFPMMV